MKNIKQNIENIISYLADEGKHFWENFECSDEIQEAEDFDKCKCEANKIHILRDAVAVESWLNSPSCPLVDSEELEEEEELKGTEGQDRKGYTDNQDRKNYN